MAQKAQFGLGFEFSLFTFWGLRPMSRHLGLLPYLVLHLGPRSILVFSNSMFGYYRFGFGYGFEGVQIQILCLDKLKELDLDLAQIHLRFQGSKSMDLKSSHKPKNLEILPSVLYTSSAPATVMLSLPLFAVLLSLFLARLVSLNSFLPLYSLYLSFY